MNPAQYAEHTGASERSVWRWLKAGELPAASKAPDGQWYIPPDAVRQRSGTDVALTRTDMSVTRQSVSGANGHPAQGESLAEALDQHPAFLTIEEAARLLGVPETAITRHRERFAVEKFGAAISTWRVPGRIVREIAGL